MIQKNIEGTIHVKDPYWVSFHWQLNKGNWMEKMVSSKALPFLDSEHVQP